MRLYAWVGEDEYGSGEVGLKQAHVPAGLVPLVATSRGKVDTPTIRAQLQAQANTYGKTIQLIEFAPVGVTVARSALVSLYPTTS